MSNTGYISLSVAQKELDRLRDQIGDVQKLRGELSHIEEQIEQLRSVQLPSDVEDIERDVKQATENKSLLDARDDERTYESIPALENMEADLQRYFENVSDPASLGTLQRTRETMTSHIHHCLQFVFDCRSHLSPANQQLLQKLGVDLRNQASSVISLVGRVDHVEVLATLGHASPDNFNKTSWTAEEVCQAAKRLHSECVERQRAAQEDQKETTSLKQQLKEAGQAKAKADKEIEDLKLRLANAQAAQGYANRLLSELQFLLLPSRDLSKLSLPADIQDKIMAPVSLEKQFGPRQVDLQPYVLDWTLALGKATEFVDESFTQLVSRFRLLMIQGVFLRDVTELVEVMMSRIDKCSPGDLVTLIHTIQSYRQGPHRQFDHDQALLQARVFEIVIRATNNLGLRWMEVVAENILESWSTAVDQLTTSKYRFLLRTYSLWFSEIRESRFHSLIHVAMASTGNTEIDSQIQNAHETIPRLDEDTEDIKHSPRTILIDAGAIIVVDKYTRELLVFDSADIQWQITKRILELAPRRRHYNTLAHPEPFALPYLIDFVRFNMPAVYEDGRF